MQKSIPIDTTIGFLSGRDCIYLNEVRFENACNELILEGEINGNLASLAEPGKDYAYVMRFSGVLALRMVELDSWDGAGESSLDAVEESEWVRELGGKVSGRHRHICVQTYDNVFDVVCSSFAVSITSFNQNSG